MTHQTIPTGELDLSPLNTTTEIAEQVVERSFGIIGKATLLPGERDRNFQVSADTDEYLLKFSPPGSNFSLIRMQIAALEHLASVAPLDAMERENLMANAENVGVHWRAGLESLATESPLVGDVRG